MRKISLQLCVGTLVCATGLVAAPAPNSVQNPGSNTVPGLPNYGIAQGSVFVVYGAGLGPSTLMTAPSLPLQTTLGGTSVTVTVGGTTVNALMSYTYVSQIACVLPSNTPTGSGTLTVTYNGQSGSTPIVVVGPNFGILSANETGSGPAVATHADYSLITGTNAANTGETIILWGTGLGPLPSGVSDANAPGNIGNLSGTVTVYIGGVAANVTYHGRNPADPGLDQVNAVVPAGVTGCYVSVVVQTGSYYSNTTSIAVTGSGTVCSDANGVSLSDLSLPLSTNGTASVGFVSVLKDSFSISLAGISQTENESAALGSFQKYTGTQLAASSLSMLPSIGSCSVVVNLSANPSAPITATGLDAGASLSLTGPGITASLMTEAGIKGYYYSSLSSVAAGGYQITGPGGADVGAFTASVTMPATLTWTNQAAITGSPINRSQPLTLTWTGGDASSFTVIEGLSTNPITPGSNSTVGATFICIAPTAPGTFTVPASVLASLPASGNAASGSFGLLLFGSASTPVRFTASGLDYGFALTEQITGGSVTYQ